MMFYGQVKVPEPVFGLYEKFFDLSSSTGLLKDWSKMGFVGLFKPLWHISRFRALRTGIKAKIGKL